MRETEKNLLGVDLGGTKCAVIFGCQQGDKLAIIDKICFPTSSCEGTQEEIIDSLKAIMNKHALSSHNTSAIGISCGGPLDSKKGVVMNPPNLPGWNNIPIVQIISDEFGIKTGIHNDANACALAEWIFGAGRGTRNMVFLTFGTGLGAGLILNGELYAGTNDNAGEIGHIRLERFGPVGYGKAGSFEGFCSGGGIRQLGRSLAMEKMMMGETVSWCPNGNLDCITAKSIAQAMSAGDELARKVFETSALYLGKGLSILVDVLNPERIIIGSVYARNEAIMKPIVEKVLAEESLSYANSVCKVVPALLGESIGDYAALSVAANL